MNIIVTLPLSWLVVAAKHRKGRRIHYDFQIQRRNRVEFALFGGSAVQAAGGFVENEDFGLLEQGASDREALLCPPESPTPRSPISAW
jgi:hypothetical protein